MNTLQEIWNFVLDLWDTGNYWVRWALGIVVTWPILMAFAALTPWVALKASVALVPLLVVAAGIIAVFDPLVFGLIAIPKTGRRFLVWLLTIVGVELGLGTYLAAVPVSNDRGLIPLVILIAVTMGFLAVGIRNKVAKAVIWLLLVVWIILTAIFFLGGREQAGRRAENWLQQLSAPSRAAEQPSTQAITVGSEWVELPSIPYHYWFRTDPVNGLIRLKRWDDEEFIQKPGEQPFPVKGEKKPGLGDVIPGNSFFAKAEKSGEKVKVIFSLWPKKPEERK
jgi:hypothetical protein